MAHTGSGEARGGAVAGGDSPARFSRDHDAPRWLLLAIIALHLIAVGVAFAWISGSELAEHVIGEPAVIGRDEPILELGEILEEPQPRNLLGRDVALWGVPVERVVGDYVFWIGPDARRRVPVALLGESTARQSDPRTEVREGDTLSVVGTIRAIREVDMLDEAWALTADEKADLARQAVYISALRVDHVPSGATDGARRP